jgi:hypothetical protein
VGKLGEKISSAGISLLVDIYLLVGTIKTHTHNLPKTIFIELENNLNIEKLLIKSIESEQQNKL